VAIVYYSVNEILICDPKTEKQMLKEYFEEGGRSFADYTRQQGSIVAVLTRPHVYVDQM
jgi:hypothetical protein